MPGGASQRVPVSVKASAVSGKSSGSAAPPRHTHTGSPSGGTGDDRVYRRLALGQNTAGLGASWCLADRVRSEQSTWCLLPLRAPASASLGRWRAGRSTALCPFLSWDVVDGVGATHGPSHQAHPPAGTVPTPRMHLHHPASRLLRIWLERETRQREQLPPKLCGLTTGRWELENTVSR